MVSLCQQLLIRKHQFTLAIAYFSLTVFLISGQAASQSIPTQSSATVQQGIHLSDELIAGFGGALLGAIIGGLISWMQHRNEQLATKKLEFQAAIVALLEARRDYQLRIMKLSDSQEKEFESGMLNEKRMLNIEVAITVAEQIPKHISSTGYRILAQEIHMDSDTFRAERHFLKAISVASRSPLYQAIALRYLGIFYCLPGAQQSFSKAEETFDKAIKLLEPRQDPYSLYTLAFTYENWGLHLLANNFRVQGQHKLDAARKYYESLPANDVLRKTSLANLPGKIDAATYGNIGLQTTEVVAPTVEVSNPYSTKLA